MLRCQPIGGKKDPQTRLGGQQRAEAAGILKPPRYKAAAVELEDSGLGVADRLRRDKTAGEVGEDDLFKPFLPPMG